MKKMNSNLEWKKWGEVDPLFGVASWDDKQRGGAAPWTDAEFFELGKSDWQDFAKHWEQYGLNRESCLEIGCGAGRITSQLASYFRQVHAVDVSEKMIEYAQTHIQNPSVHFHLTSGIELPLEPNSVTAVFSTHVFQHFDSAYFGDRYFVEISRVMQAGGTLMIHLPMYAWPSTFKIFDWMYRLQKTAGDAKASIQRFLMNYGAATPPMRRISYSMQYFYETLPQYGFEDIELKVFAVQSNNAPHSFVFARKK